MFSSSDARAVHGGPDAHELSRYGLAIGDIVDFSVNVNPYGPSPEMLDAVRSAPLRAYPDRSSTRARAALARVTGRSVGEIIVGSGATELFWSFCRATLAEGAPVVACTPCFSELPAAAVACGARVVAVPATEANAFDLVVADVIAASRACGAVAVHVGTPTSPTGRHVSPHAIKALAHALPDAHIVLDESFLSLSERHADLAVALPTNVVRVRSLTKDHAIAGLRAGYLLADAALVRRIEAVRPSWTTSVVTEAAVIATTTASEQAFVAASRARLLDDRRALEGELARARVAVTIVRSIAPYVVARLPRALAAVDVRARLLARGVLVRDGTSFGLPSYLRLAARPAADRARLVTALSLELSSC